MRHEETCHTNTDMIKTASAFALKICSLIDFVISFTRRIVLRLRALISSGGAHMCYVASWCGPPVPGRPIRDDLCIAEVPVPSGGVLKCLMRGNTHPDLERLKKDTWDLETQILDATLTTEAHSGEITTLSVAELLYGTPGHVTFSPMDLATLMLGESYRTRIWYSRLIVTSIDTPPLRFDTLDLVDRESFFSHCACNSYEADARAASSRGGDSSGIVCRGNADKP
jgi:hypothetical protein